MSHYLDISVQNPLAVFAKKAKGFGIDTEVMLKVPKFNMTSVRLHGTYDGITKLVHEHFTPRAASMHLAAIKTGTPKRMDLKNRLLRDYRVE